MAHATRARAALCAAIALLARGARLRARAGRAVQVDRCERPRHLLGPAAARQRQGREINAPPPPANPNAVKEMATKDAELKKAKQARADEEAKATKARVDANELREQCERARGQMLTLAQLGPGRPLQHQREGRARRDGRRRATARSASASTRWITRATARADASA